MKKFKIATISVLMLFIGQNFSFSQESPDKMAGFDRFSVGLGLGVFTHFGDVKKEEFFPVRGEFSIGGGLNLNYFLSPTFTLRTQFALGGLKGDDVVEGYRFESNLWEANLQGVVSLSKLLVPLWAGNKRFDIYAATGIGMVGYRTLLYKNNVLHREIGYSGNGTVKESRKFNMYAPLSFGVRYNLSPRIDVFFEKSTLFTTTDNLDGLNRPGSNNDAFNRTKAGIKIKLGRNNRPLDWESPVAFMFPGYVERMDVLSQRIAALEKEVQEHDTRATVETHNNEIQNLKTQIRTLEQNIDKLHQIVSTKEQVVKPMGHEPSVVALLSVHFSLNSAKIDELNYERIAAAARFLKANPEMKLEIVGHADISGPAVFNMALSERRAKAVFDLLVNDFSIDPDRLQVAYKGEDNPFSNHNLGINRRVDFKVIRD
ncbi:MAG TPA: OmpA family protein [Bacteroidales bacterium]|nr:OmpA family protein [Bacteroidales bacterium]